MFALRHKTGLYYHAKGISWRREVETATVWNGRERPDLIVAFWTLGELNEQTKKRTGGNAVIGGYSGWDVEVVEVPDGIGELSWSQRDWSQA